MSSEHKRNLQIAIDGPVASGKGEIAARLARELHLVYIYTGAMYRALALSCIRGNISCKDEAAVVEHLKHILIDLREPLPESIRSFSVFLNSEDVTERIFAQDVAMGASDVGAIPAVRKDMVVKQQAMAGEKRVVMEGRDIGLRVLPSAQMKVYLTASVEERAKRRFLQWKLQGIKKTLEETLEDTKARDDQDMHRATDPLVKLPDSWELDTTNLTPEDVVFSIKNELTQRGLL